MEISDIKKEQLINKELTTILKNIEIGTLVSIEIKQLQKLTKTRQINGVIKKKKVKGNESSITILTNVFREKVEHTFKIHSPLFISLKKIKL